VTTVVIAEAGIEGAKVKGHSRHPLRKGGMKLLESGRVGTYYAEHNVRAEVVECCSESEPVIVTPANRSVGDEVSCEKAVIYTSARKPASEEVLPTTGTHKANHWKFVKPTHVRVVLPHPQIANAIAKRASEANPEE
jgi:hypothetical protein